VARNGGTARSAKGSRVSVLVFGDKVAGYANYGATAARSLHFEGEIYELYLRPEFQGLGFGRRLSLPHDATCCRAALKSMVIWRFSDKRPATEFYRASRPHGRTLLGKIWAKSLDKVASPGPTEAVEARCSVLGQAATRDLKPDLRAKRSTHAH